MALEYLLRLSKTEKSDIGLLFEMPYVDYDEVGDVCAECGRLFRSSEDLEAHRRESHGPARSSSVEKPPTASLPCSLCPKRFRSIAALQDHTRRDHST
jgi:C2H2 type zinc finger protein/C2H2-type zinc finger protein